jgi:hypothetical protein
VVSTTIVTAIGVAAGLAVAGRLTNAQGQASGIGWGDAASPPPATVAALVAAALAAAAAAALFLAVRAVRAPVPRPSAVLRR